MREDIRIGATFPDYELPDHTDTPRKLSFLQGDDPMVLTLNRSVFCPKDRQQLMGLAAFYPQICVGYSRLVTIIAENLIMTNDLRLGVGAFWPFLHDEKRIVAKDLDIAEYTAPAPHPMVPHTFVLEPGLKIHKIYNGYWYWGRPSTSELHADLREVTRKCRWDFDLGNPEVRAAWQRGEKDRFAPYGKSFRQMFVRMAGEVDQFE
jgi:peroxiredoxin